MEEGYRVYIKIDQNNNIVAINSSVFMTNTDGWLQIDEGFGDKYHHAQNYYLEKPIVDVYGRYNYRFINGEIIEIPEADKPSIPVVLPTIEERLEGVEQVLLDLLSI